jgi:CelD/BcsL family acetyltransferase involved in cellulose biosynthesis
MIAAPLCEAPEDLVARWRHLYARAGVSIHQSPEYAAAIAESGALTWVVADDEAIGAFAVRDGVATSLGATRAFLAVESVTSGGVLQRACAVLARESGARLVYFPHVYAETVAAPDPSTGIASWARLPNPHVDCLAGDDLWSRVRERYGSRATRQRRRAETSGLEQRTLVGDEAADAVDRVERRTWKALAGHSMHQREDQYAVFARLLRDRQLTAAVLLDGERPVAFRIDAHIKRTVYCLKWSYDEAYRRCSPGFYLLTCGLAHDWDYRAVDRIDLFGSPDALKALVATGHTERVDFAWPRSAATSLAAERKAHDRAAAQALRDGIGLRRLYLDADARGVAHGPSG